MLGSDTIKRVEASKSLGVYIDEHLSWSAHIDYIAKKISTALVGLRQTRPYVPTDTAIAIYRSMILPLFDYCDVVWASLNKGLADRIQRLQNRAARIIMKYNYDTRSAEVLKNLKWDTLGQRRQLRTASMMHKTMNKRTPLYLSDRFQLICESTGYNLRDAIVNISLPNPKTEYLKRSFSYRGPKLWNSLPSESKRQQSHGMFMKTVRALDLQSKINSM